MNPVRMETWAQGSSPFSCQVSPGHYFPPFKNSYTQRLQDKKPLLGKKFGKCYVARAFISGLGEAVSSDAAF